MKGKITLSREMVLKAGIALADEVGTAALSMRKLGRSLNVEAMSLYNHIHNKDDLLSGMTDLIIAEIGFPNKSEDWRDSIVNTAIATRKTLLKHPWAAKQIQSQVHPTAIRLKRADEILGVFCEAGFSYPCAYKGHLTIESYVYGFVMQELNWAFEEQDQGKVAAQLSQSLSIREYPYLMAMLASIEQTKSQQAIARHSHGYDADFIFGVNILLDGLELLRTL